MKKNMPKAESPIPAQLILVAGISIIALLVAFVFGWLNLKIVAAVAAFAVGFYVCQYGYYLITKNQQDPEVGQNRFGEVQQRNALQSLSNAMRSGSLESVSEARPAIGDPYKYPPSDSAKHLGNGLKNAIEPHMGSFDKLALNGAESHHATAKPAGFGKTGLEELARPSRNVDAEGEGYGHAHQQHSHSSHSSSGTDEVNGLNEKVSNLVTVIDQVALQANLLAMSAAVEAVCAGAYGKELETVASKVRQLANKNIAITKEVRDLIKAKVSKYKDHPALVPAPSDAMRGITEAITNINTLLLKYANKPGQQAPNGIEPFSQALAANINLMQRETAVMMKQNQEEEVPQEAQSRRYAHKASAKPRGGARRVAAPHQAKTVKSSRTVNAKVAKAPTVQAKKALASNSKKSATQSRAKSTVARSR